MNPFPTFPLQRLRHALLGPLLCLAAAAASAQPAPPAAAPASGPTPAALPAEAARAIEQTLLGARDDKRGVMLFVGGQAVAGAVLQLQPGQWVELRNPQHARIFVRLDRIDGVARP